jgi:uncharacterized protein
MHRRLLGKRVYSAVAGVAKFDLPKLGFGLMRMFVFLMALLFFLYARSALASELEDAIAADEHGDYSSALRLLRPLAEARIAEAEFYLGSLYEKGHGVPQDYKLALKWYESAAEQGLTKARTVLGSMYRNGLGVARNYKQAVKYYQPAADAGFSSAQFYLGLMYQLGQGVSQNDREAAKWYALAAEQGNADAQSRLGIMYALGTGVPQDYVRAYMWLSVAAEKSSGEIKRRGTVERDNLASEMTPDQIAAARESAQKCSQSEYKQCR